MAGIYIHIPFCKQACHYCDFHFSTNIIKRAEVLQAIAKEIAMQKLYLKGEKICTIYFGGGTPSLLTTEELSLILNSIYDTFSVSPFPEITLEANPDDLLHEKLIGLKNIGINRLSIGIQSFDDNILKFLNRAHDARLAINCIEKARRVGFENISIDLMYAIPGQDMKMWEKNIKHALLLNPEHLSSYSLTIEETTVFGRWTADKKIRAPDNDDSARELLLLLERLELGGYEHYEVSNFSKPGFVSKHNSSYWKEVTYLGVGPSAHSYDGHSRQFNLSNNHLYLHSIKKGQIPATVEVLTREEKINDFLLTSLRTSWGANLEKLCEDHQYDLLKNHGDYVQQLIEHKYAILSDKSLILTKNGRLLADKIASDLFTMTYS